MFYKTIFLIFTLFSASLYATKLNELDYIGIKKFAKNFGISLEINVELLRGGMSSSSVYKINLPEKSLVIRILSKNTPIENRISELNMHKFLSEKGLAPEIVFTDNEKNPYIIVIDYINGRIFNPKTDLNNENILNQIIQGLRIIHNFSNTDIFHNKPMLESIGDSVQGIKISKKKVPSEFFKWYDQLTEVYKKYKTSKIIIHGDLAPGNILISDDKKVYFIDFQESRRDSVFAEFGYFFYESGIDDPKTMRYVLEKYFNRKVSDFELKATLFYVKATAFLAGVFRLCWIDGRYESEDLDKIMKNLKESGISYFKKGDYDKIELDQISSENRAKYVLSFFKDFENMKVE